MTIALFGASGGTGRQVLAQALARGHSVRALARTPAKLADVSDPKLTAIQGDALSADDDAKALEGADVAIVVLGVPPQAAGSILSDSAKAIIAAAKVAGVKRILVQSSLGVGDSAGRISPVMRVVVKTTMAKLFADKDAQEAAVRESGLQWTIVRPATLGNGAGTGAYEASERMEKSAKAIDRADVAKFLLDEAEKPAFIGKVAELRGA